MAKEKIMKFMITAALLLGISASNCLVLSADEAVQTFYTGEQIIVSIDGLSGEYINARATGNKDTYEGSGSMGADGTILQEDWEDPLYWLKQGDTGSTVSQTTPDSRSSLQIDPTLTDQDGWKQKLIVWDNFEQVISDLEKTGSKTVFDQSDNLLNIVIEGAIKRPQASKINDAVEEYKELLDKKLIDPHEDFSEYKKTLEGNKDAMTDYINDLYRQIAEAYNKWSEDHSSAPEISLTDTGLEYTLTVSDFDQVDREIKIPFSSIRFYPTKRTIQIPVFEPGGDWDSVYFPLRDGMYEEGAPRMFCGYEVERSHSGIYYIQDDEGDIYCLTVDDLCDPIHSYYYGYDPQQLFDIDVDGTVHSGINHREWWLYEKQNREMISGQPYENITIDSIGAERDIEYRNIIIPAGSGLDAVNPGETPSVVFDPEDVTGGITLEDIQIENARILEEIYKLLEDTMLKQEGFPDIGDIQPRFDSVEQWMEEKGQIFIGDTIKNISPEEILDYLKQNQGLDLTEAQELMQKTFDDNSERLRFQYENQDTSKGTSGSDPENQDPVGADQQQEYTLPGFDAGQIILPGSSEEWSEKFSNFQAYASSSMEDVCDVILYEQYQLDSVRYMEVNTKNYNSNLRRWHIYHNGVEMAIPITDNPRHQIAITAFDPGEYIMTADQWVEQAQVANVEYTVQKTLVEKSTGRLLYQVVNQGRSNNGSGIFKLGDGSSGHWEATNEYMKFTVNDLGNIVDDDDKSKVQRIH